MAYNGIGLRNVRLATQVVLSKLRIDFKTKNDFPKQNYAWFVGRVIAISVEHQIPLMCYLGFRIQEVI